MLSCIKKELRRSSSDAKLPRVMGGTKLQGNHMLGNLRGRLAMIAAMGYGMGWPAETLTGLAQSLYMPGVVRYQRKGRASGMAQQQRASRKAKNVKRARAAGRG